MPVLVWLVLYPLICLSPDLDFEEDNHRALNQARGSPVWGRLWNVTGLCDLGVSSSLKVKGMERRERQLSLVLGNFLRLKEIITDTSLRLMQGQSQRGSYHT